MAKNKYSSELQDAYMLGDLKRVAELKSLIEAQKPQKSISRPTVVYGNNILNKQDAPAMKIYDFLNSKYGKEWIDDEYETLDRMLLVDYGAVLEDGNRDKVMALRHLSKSFNSYTDWYEFNQIALALGGATADFENLRRPSPGMLINAVKIMQLLQGDETFSSDVTDYISICLINDGIYTPPPSIASLIARSMKDLTSTTKNWASIGAKYDKRVIDETVSGIQARRLVVAEEAARKYFA
jgi:hypothetical protein